MDQELISYRYSSYSSCSFCWGDALQKTCQNSPKSEDSVEPTVVENPKFAFGIYVLSVPNIFVFSVPVAICISRCPPARVTFIWKGFF